MKYIFLLLYFVQTAVCVELNETNLAQCIVSLKIENKEMAFKIAMLESGNLKSGLAIKGNNLFGMRYNRRGFCSDTIYGYAFYKCWQLSVIDYFYWQKRYSRGYAKDLNYRKKLSRIKIKKEVLRILREKWHLENILIRK